VAIISRWRPQVRIPTALPFVFTALKISSVLAMIGAIVGEYFGSDFNALGVLINSKSSTFDFKGAWAGIVVACLFGIARATSRLSSTSPQAASKQ